MESLLISNGIKKFTRSAKSAAKNNVLLKLLLIFVAISVDISCHAQRSGDVKVDVTGNWQITISVAEGTIIGKGSLSQTGDVDGLDRTKRK